MGPIDMDKDYLLQITVALYRVTELLPEKEPLKVLIREKADRILADGCLLFAENPIGLNRAEKKRLFKQILANLGILEKFFELAQKQNWVDKANFLVLQSAYDKVGQAIKAIFLSREFSTGPFRNGSDTMLGLSLNNRTKKILEVLQKQKTAQVKDIKEVFPQVSKRTLRRDFDELLSKGLVKRLGNGNRTIYCLANRTELGQD